MTSKFSKTPFMLLWRSKVPIYVMSSRDTKIKRTLLESGHGLFAKEYDKNQSYGHTRIHDNMVPSALRALSKKIAKACEYSIAGENPLLRLRFSLICSRNLANVRLGFTNLWRHGKHVLFLKQQRFYLYRILY